MHELLNGVVDWHGKLERTILLGLVLEHNE
jgi:hypothetical protein